MSIDGERLVNIEKRQEAMIAAISTNTSTLAALATEVIKLVEAINKPAKHDIGELLRQLTALMTTANMKLDAIYGAVRAPTPPISHPL